MDNGKDRGEIILYQQNDTIRLESQHDEIRQIKDLGKKWTAIMKMESIDPTSLLSHI